MITHVGVGLDDARPVFRGHGHEQAGEGQPAIYDNTVSWCVCVCVCVCVERSVKTEGRNCDTVSWGGGDVSM